MLLLAVVAAVVPYLHATVSQRAEIAAARAQVQDTQGDIDQLQTEVSRWDDPSYVRREARERLHYVMPGDTPYIVVGSSPSAQAEEDPSGAAAAQAQETATDDRPWFGTLWDSVAAAGEADQP